MSSENQLAETLLSEHIFSGILVLHTPVNQPFGLALAKLVTVTTIQLLLAILSDCLFYEK